MGIRMLLAIKTILIAFVLVAGAGPAEADPAIGKTLKADQRLTGSSGNRRLRIDAPIYSRETLRTNATGIGQFELRDQTRLALGNNARLRLNKTVLAPGSSSFTRLALTSASGALRVITGNSNSSAYEVRTPVATLGTRGTAFDLYFYRGRLYVMSLTGEIDVCNLSGVCRTLQRKCDAVVVSPLGGFSDTFQPQNGIFSAQDMARFFPFVANQTNLVPELQLPVLQCAGGNGGSDGGEPGEGGPAPSEPGNPGPTPDPSPGDDGEGEGEGEGGLS